MWGIQNVSVIQPLGAPLKKHQRRRNLPYAIDGTLVFEKPSQGEFSHDLPLANSIEGSTYIAVLSKQPDEGNTEGNSCAIFLPEVGI